MKNFLDLLDLQDFKQNCFVGSSKDNVWPRLFGGLIVAQSVVAAYKTIDDSKYIHSLHAYFVRAGDVKEPIIYEVTNIRDGKSFSVREVKAIQKDQVLLVMTCSFHKQEQGYNYQKDYVAVDVFTDLRPIEQYLKDLDETKEKIAKYWYLQQPFIFYPVDGLNYITRKCKSAKQQYLFKLKDSDQIPISSAMNSAFLTYLSDMTILDNSLYMVNESIFTGNIQSASLDHSLWFHHNIDWHDYILYEIETSFIGGNRSLNKGSFYDRNGRLLATSCQEGLIRFKIKN